MADTFPLAHEPCRSIAWIAWLLVCFIAPIEAATDSRLPDGTDFIFWEKPLTFTKTYYVDGSSSRSDDRGPGTLERPFRTIGKAAEVLQPGERAVIAAGTYRECIRPARGGSGPEKMISYEAAPGAVVIVKGSEILSEGWEPSTEPLRDGGPARIWKHERLGFARRHRCTRVELRPRSPGTDDGRLERGAESTDLQWHQR